jgi:hypothetical protein
MLSLQQVLPGSGEGGGTNNVYTCNKRKKNSEREEALSSYKGTNPNMGAHPHDVI